MMINCCSCLKNNLSKDEVGITKKMLGEKIADFYCLNCLAEYLEVAVDDILDKIDEFKVEGCTLFN